MARGAAKDSGSARGVTKAKKGTAPTIFCADAGSVFDHSSLFFPVFYRFLIRSTEIGRFRVDRYTNDFSGELVVALFVIVRDSGFSIFTHVSAFISGEGEGLGLRNSSFGDLLTIHIEDGFPSSAGLR